MRIFVGSLIALAIVASQSAPVYSAECVKTYDPKSKSALDGEPCANPALNEADMDLNSSYEYMVRTIGGAPVLWDAQEHWVAARNNCVSTERQDCVVMTKARTAFFRLMSGTESGERKFSWFGSNSGSLGSGGHEMIRVFYQFSKPTTDGEKLFNKVMFQEFMGARDTVGSLADNMGRSPDRRCFNWLIAGTAALNDGILRVPFHLFLGCRDPQAVETTSFIAVDLDHAVVLQ